MPIAPENAPRDDLRQLRVDTKRDNVERWSPSTPAQGVTSRRRWVSLDGGAAGSPIVHLPASIGSGARLLGGAPGREFIGAGLSVERMAESSLSVAHCSL